MDFTATTILLILSGSLYSGRVLISEGLQGKFISVECKTGKNKRTLWQEQFPESMVNDGCIYILAFDLKDVENVL